MVDETDNEGERPTPPAPALSGLRPDETIKLDRAIAYGNLSLPSHFGRYQVLNRIGIGGFASVYSANDPDLEAPVAIKVLAENHSANLNVRRRFVAEARVARRLGSDRLIGVFDLGETDDGRPFVVMELADRGTLRQRVVKTGRPTIDDLIRLIVELGACMEAVHVNGIVHRDIKPSNLLFRATEHTPDFEPTRLIEDGERLVLADFGLARDISDGASAVTVGGGTEGYMAPEQNDPRGKADYRADIFSATVVMAELTTGRHPERLDLSTADISADVLEALTAGMSIDRERRPATAAEWTDKLLTAYRHQAETTTNRGPALPYSANDATELLDRTKVQAPYPYNSDIDDLTDIPETGLGDPVPFTSRPDPTPGGLGVDAPAPPPSLPIDPSLQPPPPRPPAPDPEPRPVPSSPGLPAGQVPEATPPSPPTFPQTPTPWPAAQPTPTPAPPPTQAPGAQAASATRPAPATPLPHPQTQPAPHQPPRHQPVVRQPPPHQPAPAPRQPRPRHQSLPPRSGQPAAAVPISKAEPLAGPGSAGAAGLYPASSFVEPVSPEAAAEEATTRSKQHLKTAKKLAKLEQKQSRKRARKARRRRRRLLVVNFFLSLVRGVLGAVVTFIIAAVIAQMVTEGELNDLPRAQGIVSIVTVIGFLWGMAYFPFPRPREI